MELYSIIVPMVLLGVLLAIGMPIGFTLLLAALLGMIMQNGFNAAIHYLATHAFGSVSVFVFTPLPLFVLMGNILSVSGVGPDLFGVALKWFGKLRGGLAVASVVACAVFASMCGLSIAGSATIGQVSIPEMLKRGYDKGLATGCVCAAGTLGILIPPSLPFIMYGVISQQSIGQLFIAGIVPGIMLTIFFSAYILFITWRQPAMAPAIEGVVTWKDRLFSLRRLWSALVLIAMVLGTIYGGIATPTEAAGIGALGAMFVTLLYRSLSLKMLIQVLKNTAELMGFIMIIVVGAMMFSVYLTMTGVTQSFSHWMVSFSAPGWVILIMINFVLLILGCFLDSTSIILITTPLFLPLIISNGLHPIWYGVMLIINIEIAFITPPVGMNLYVVSKIAPEVPLYTILWGTMPFVLLALLAICMIAIFPQLALWLPSTTFR